MFSRALADRLHKAFVFVCFGTTIVGTGIAGYRFAMMLSNRPSKDETVVTKYMDEVRRIDPEALPDGPITRA
ncbi:Hypothetical protein NTJ_13114 [Nesidiocoris tenuis]|uniref:Mitochondrial cytochrome c oxidase subunit VIc/VIIs domain-containing protein n=1 Tax=Nesidiocoris tenuis TaxID=355587 RepID=A0ABN7B7E4_9HEMI|nr:Hypothetical protein NTJ_13114 [Nesidiocoris tenuis]